MILPETLALALIAISDMAVKVRTFGVRRKQTVKNMLWHTTVGISTTACEAYFHTHGIRIITNGANC